jgi:hypothetical protein
VAACANVILVSSRLEFYYDKTKKRAVSGQSNKLDYKKI